MAGGQAPVLVACDSGRGRRHKLAAVAVAGLGRVDILSNNAGGSRSFGLSCGVSEDAWQEAITLNFHRPRQPRGRAD